MLARPLGIILLFGVGSLSALELTFPVACVLDDNCYIQHYVDQDPDHGFADYQGGRLSYDGHKGTDIGVTNYLSLKQHIPVIAAAPGKVLRTRSKMPDRCSVSEHQHKFSCGNGVVIEHEGGYETQYCHLKQGSIKVFAGDVVEAGDLLGFIGNSGRSDFPHLHFTLTRHQQVVDPFQKSFFLPPIGYQRRGIIDMGLSALTPTKKEVLCHPVKLKTLHQHIGRMVAWVRIFGVLKGDRERFTFYTPDGRVYRKPHVKRIDTSFKAWFSFMGYKVPKHVPTSFYGTWRVTYELQSSEGPWQLMREYTFDFKRV